MFTSLHRSYASFEGSELPVIYILSISWILNFLHIPLLEELEHDPVKGYATIQSLTGSIGKGEKAKV